MTRAKRPGTVKLRASSFDVAKLAGVSRSAVSRTFTLGASASEATRAKVIRAAKQLGYHPNAIARILTTRQSKIVAVVVADLENPFYAKAVSCMSSRLQACGYTMFLLVAESSQTIDDLIPRLLSYQADGVVVASALLSSAVTEYCLAAGLPVVQFNRYTAFEGASTVQSDNFAGGMMAAEHLLACGHKRIAFVAGIDGTSSSIDRERGLRAGLEQQGAAVWARAVGGYSYAGGMSAADEFLSGGVRPDAVFCANDMMALAFIDAAVAKGLRVPSDLSVIGFDNIPLADFAHYGLTTVDQNVNLMATEAVDLLLTTIRGHLEKPQKRTIQCRLVTRRSVRNVAV